MDRRNSKSVLARIDRAEAAKETVFRDHALEALGLHRLSWEDVRHYPKVEKQLVADYGKEILEVRQ